MKSPIPHIALTIATCSALSTSILIAKSLPEDPTASLLDLHLTELKAQDTLTDAQLDQFKPEAGRLQFHKVGESELVLAGELKDTLNYKYNAPPKSRRQEGDGSIIIVLATDVPLLPHQLKRVAQRIPLGVGIVGGRGSNGSGDIFLAFSTANEQAFNRDDLAKVETYPNDQLFPVFEATVQAVEEAIINAMIAAETMEGINGNKAYALPHDLLKATLKKYNRLND